MTAVPKVQNTDQRCFGHIDVSQVLLLERHDVTDEVSGRDVPKFDFSFAAGSDDERVVHGDTANLALKKMTKHL